MNQYGGGYGQPQSNYAGLGFQHPGGNFQISNHTSDQDPQSKLSRIFVGNLNPVEVTQQYQLYNLFCKYGKIRAISVQKGYGFVQFTTEREARAAVAGEQGRMVGSQTLDLCISTERGKPKNKTYDSDFDSGYGNAGAKKRRFQDNTNLANSGPLTKLTEQRVNLKFMVRLGKTPSEALGMLQQVYGEETMSSNNVFEWCKQFQEGRDDVGDDNEVLA